MHKKSDSSSSHPIPTTFGRRSSVPLSVGTQQDAKYIRHQITNADTLINICIRYEVPIAEVRRMNHLSSDDIWFKHELIIPRTILPPTFTLFSKSLESTATSALKAIAVCHATNCETSTAKSNLRARRGNFDDALKDCQWVNEMCRKYGVTEDKAMVYLDMHPNSLERAEIELREDLPPSVTCFPFNIPEMSRNESVPVMIELRKQD